MKSTPIHRWWTFTHKITRRVGEALGVWNELRIMKMTVEKLPWYQRLSERRQRLAKFADALGKWKGLHIFAATKFGWNPIPVKMAGIRHPLTIRPRTSDKSVFEQIFLDLDYELPLCNSPRLIVDAGANVGFASIYFANKYPDATIIALEPASENFRVLLRNTKEYPQIIALQAALWSTSAMLSVNDQVESWACTVAPLTDGHTSGIPGLSVTDLLERYQYSSVDILKIDIEGAEREVFGGDCRSWLTKTKVLIVELHDRFWPGCSQALDRAIAGLAFLRIEQGENTILLENDLVSGEPVHYHGTVLR